MKKLKIGWCRLTMMVELDLNKTTKGFAAMRAGYMKALVAQGHTIKILTGLGKRHTQTTLEEVHAGTHKSDGDYDVSWLKSVEYDPEGSAKDCDLLVVESSALNWMYPCKITNQPAIRRCIQVIDSFKGTVIVEQSDPDLPFPMAKLGTAKYEWSHPDNPYRNNNIKGEDGMEDFAWADRDEIWKDKEYFVCIRGAVKRMLKGGFACGPRFQYDVLHNGDKPFTVIQTPQTYDFSVALDSDMNEQKKHDLVYTGYPRTPIRERSFLENMQGFDDDLRKVVTGPWTSRARQGLRYDAYGAGVLQAGNFSWREFQKFASSCKFSLFLGVQRAYAYNWKTNKPFEAIANQCVLLYDDRMPYLKSWFGKHLMLDGDYDFWSFFIREIDSDDYLELWRAQYEVIKSHTWESYLLSLEKQTGSVLLKTKARKKTRLSVKKARNTDRIIELHATIESIVNKYRKLYVTREEDWMAGFNAPYSQMVREASTARMQDLVEPAATEDHEKPECYGKEYEAEHYTCASECPFRLSCSSIEGNATDAGSDTSDTDEEETDEASEETVDDSSTDVTVATANILQEPNNDPIPSSALVINVRLPQGVARREIIINITQE